MTKEEQELKELKKERDLFELMLFTVIRNNGVLTLGRTLHKTEEEISEKTFETIDELKKVIDIANMTEIMNQATRRRKGDGNNE